MRAVNLIPTEDRRGAGGAAGRSGGAVYVLLGALGALVLIAAAYAMSSRTVHEKQTTLARVERDAQAAEAKASALQGFTQFSALRQKRIQTVQSIADSRFDWSYTMHEIARTIPRNVSLTSLVGTVSPTVPLQGAGGGGSSLRGAIPSPAVELTGCTTSQDNVARMMAAMRQVDGVRRVSLQSSTKADSAGGAGAAAGGGCSGASGKDPQFAMVIFFDPKPAPSAPAAGGTTGTPGATDASGQPVSQPVSQPTSTGSAK